MELTVTDTGGRTVLYAPVTTGSEKDPLPIGEWKVNGRTLEDYFPNKVHQQEVNEPFKVLELEGRYDVIARIRTRHSNRPALIGVGGAQGSGKSYQCRAYAAEEVRFVLQESPETISA